MQSIKTSSKKQAQEECAIVMACMAKPELRLLPVMMLLATQYPATNPKLAAGKVPRQ